MKETEIQKVICQYLFDIKGYFGWRQNTAPTIQKDIGGWRFRRMPKYSRKGIPDIILLINGKPFFIEVKTKVGRQTPDQKLFQEECIKQGITYCLARSATDVMECGL